MKHRTQTAILALISLITTVYSRCDSFNNVTVTVHLANAQRHNVQVTGCIERIAFQDTRIEEIHITKQNITKLDYDSVRNMLHLHSVYFENNKIRVIKPSAFRNLPNLKILKIRQGKIEAIPNEVFNLLPKLNTLKLSNNRIKSIEDAAFANIETLETLYCDHNDIREWEKSWFRNSSNLIIINFSDNKIKILPRRAFSDLPKLEIVNFNSNELEVIESEIFEGITKLQYFGLKYNRLKTIHPRVFPRAIFIKSFALQANYLTFVTKTVMVNVGIQKLGIDGNPWKCSCLDQVFFWVKENNGTIETDDQCVGEDIPVCAVPAAFSRSCREVVEEDVIQNFLTNLRKRDPPLTKSCARLD